MCGRLVFARLHYFLMSTFYREMRRKQREENRLFSLWSTNGSAPGIEIGNVLAGRGLPNGLKS